MTEYAPQYQVTERFKNLADNEAELTAKLESSTNDYDLKEASKRFVRSRLYAGLAVRSQYWSWSSSDDCRSGNDRQVLALNLFTGEVEWLKDGGDNDGYPEKGCLTVNATNEQRHQALKWLRENNGTKSDRELVGNILNNAEKCGKIKEEESFADVTKIRIGSSVKVVRGRKIPVGTTGVVVWVGESPNYGRSGTTTRIGMSQSGKKVGKIYPDVLWTALSNVELNNPLLIATAEESSKRIGEARRVQVIGLANKKQTEIMQQYEMLLP